MTTEQQIAWLDSPDAVASLSKSARKKLRRRLRGAVRDAKRQRAATCVAMYPHVCSAWWAEAVFVALDAAGVLSDNAAQNMDHALRRGVYPVKTEREGTGQRRCVECGAWYPRHAVTLRGICDDCGSGDHSYTTPRERSVLVRNVTGEELGQFGVHRIRKR